MVLERKISDTLEDMGEVLSRYYAPTHHRLYPLKRLEIPVSLINHRLRLSELTPQDRDTLILLKGNLIRYVDHYGIDMKSKYYVNLLHIKLRGVLTE